MSITETACEQWNFAAELDATESDLVTSCDAKSCEFSLNSIALET